MTNPDTEPWVDKNFVDWRDRTLFLFGKQYHWERDERNMLSLKPGATNYDEIRQAIYEKLREKMGQEAQISRQMIEDVVANAESRAIMAAVQEDENAPKEA